MIKVVSSRLMRMSLACAPQAKRTRRNYVHLSTDRLLGCFAYLVMHARNFVLVVPAKLVKLYFAWNIS